MNYAVGDNEELFNRFRLHQARIADIAAMFQNPGRVITHEEFMAWLRQADGAADEYTALLLDAVREVHLGAKA